MARDGGPGRSGHLLVVSCDGPFGPYRVAKPGVLIVARESGLPIQPWAVAARPPFRLSGRWDRMIVALPFGRLRVFEAPVLEVGERDRIKPRLAELQARLDDVQARADLAAGGTTPAATATGVSSASWLLEERGLPAIGDLAAAGAWRHQPGLPAISHVALSGAHRANQPCLPAIGQGLGVAKLLRRVSRDGARQVAIGQPIRGRAPNGTAVDGRVRRNAATIIAAVIASATVIARP